MKILDKAVTEVASTVFMIAVIAVVVIPQMVQKKRGNLSQ